MASYGLQSLHFLLQTFLLVLSTLPLQSDGLEATNNRQCLWDPLGSLWPRWSTMCFPPLDNIPARHDHKALWTSPPWCVRYINEDGKESKESKESVYCLFTSATFRGGLGVSIITTPEIAASIAGTGELDDLQVPWESSKHSLVLGVENDDGPVYLIKEIPGKGKGVVAKRRIRRGEVFMVDFPTMVVDSNFLEVVSPKERSRLLRRGLYQLPEATQKTVLSLARSSKGEEIVNILDTNTCSIQLDDTMENIGLFPEFARVNHACDPNAFYRFSQRSLTMELVAEHDIKPGEEINISYLEIGELREFRQEYLRENWGFDCSCSRCSSSREEIANSDSRRTLIPQLRGNISEAHAKREYARAVELGEELINILKVEGLMSLGGGFSQIMARLYRDINDIRNAKKYGKLALEDQLLFYGEGSVDVERARLFLNRLEKAVVGSTSVVS